MKISIIHPSRGRTEQAYNTYRTWTERAENWNNFEYILSVDIDQHFEYYKRFDNFNGKYNLLGLPNKSAIEAINNAAKIATGDILIVVSDDFDCQQHWDTKLLNHIKGRTDFCAKTIDGLQPTLITLPVMNRVYYERYGYIYHPDYRHMFSDQEMTAVAIMTGKYIKLPILFEHLHYSAGKSAKDAINDKNDATWTQGQNLFNQRLKTNFGLKDSEIVKPYSEIVWR